jgi:hypothetical protein
MLKNVKVYYRDNGKTSCINVTSSDNYGHAIWSVRNQILGCKEHWFDVKGPAMAVVQKDPA